MQYLALDNPTRSPNQTFDIPFGSRVFITLKPDAFPNLYFKLLTLDDNMWPEHNLVWPNNESSECMWIQNPDGTRTAYKYYYKNNLTVSKLYLNEVSEPFSRVVNAKVYGATQSVDGVATKTAIRASYIGNDGNTYLFDSVRLSTLIYTPDVVEGSPETDWRFVTDLGILRNSEGTILGYASYGNGTTRPIKVGRRIHQTYEYMYNPETVHSEYSNFIPRNYVCINVSGSYTWRIEDIPDANITPIGEVEISDCPNISYTVADPITVPIKINYLDKSYFYIQF